jgi:hypothetical protein
MMEYVANREVRILPDAAAIAKRAAQKFAEAAVRRRVPSA